MAQIIEEMDESYLDPPDFIEDGDYRSARFRDPGRLHACILKAACMVNVLHASRLLIEQGWLHEAGALFRQINELVGDLYFLLENELADDESSYQRKYLDGYFVELFTDAENVLGTTESQYRVPRSKIHSASVRLLAEFGIADPSSNRQYLTTLYRAYSAYAHASYATLMDTLCVSDKGRLRVGRRRIDGKRDDMFEQFRLLLKECVVPLAILALRLDIQPRFNQLRDLEAEL